MKRDRIKEFIIKHKGYSDLQALKAAYQVRLLIRATIYNAIILVLLTALGLFKECLILFVMFKLFRTNAGGIHLVGHIKCLMYSTFTILSTILLSKYIKLNIYIELSILLFIVTIWYLYVPKGTSQRPIRREEEKKRMKIKTLIYIIITIILRFINIEIYELAIWALFITLLFTTPLAYKIFKVKYDRLVETVNQLT